MQIIEIVPLDNGAHRNQTLHDILPAGWAYIPEAMELPETFPFVNIEVEGDVVVSMTAGTMPEPEPEPEPVEDVTWSALAEAITEGVNAI